MKEMNSSHALQILPYEMKGMNFYHALQLFNRRVFLEGSLAEDDFDRLSRDIVFTTGSLPLALEVIGSLLHGKPKARWEKTLDKSREIPDEKVQKTLMISYDALNDHRREIFLDVACLFTNEDICNANYTWEACEFHPEIEDLVRMSLIKIKDNNKFWMHNQLRDLGREIVHKESPKNLGKRSRLWTSEAVLDLVKTKERKEDVEALDLLGRSSHISIIHEEIERFESLRFLRLSYGTLHGDFIVCLPKLRWLSWCSPSPDFSVCLLFIQRI
ncbi:disease resistance protein L6-like [Syzygium oleosum]|uniref:disease resistance protein L6-like n=1 Tax=Syzygium oleosum TaxID=219896 RepID=UPI0024B96866|nr:disease resistance protein L6-like [Syzygium oleosum]